MNHQPTAASYPTVSMSDGTLRTFNLIRRHACDAQPLPLSAPTLLRTVERLSFSDPSWVRPRADGLAVVFGNGDDSVSAERRGDGWIVLGDPLAETVTTEGPLLLAVERALLSRCFIRRVIEAQ